MRPIVLLLMLFALGNVAVAQENASSAKSAMVKGPLSPEESLKHLVLGAPNLVIEIAAAEPEVIDPVSIQFDEHGRMWVVEMRDYPTGPENAPPPLGGKGAKPLSRIKLLEDKDGDGRYETAHVFADKLLFATGVQPWDGGVIVTLAGEVAYFKDTDGDHKADVRETWFTGFSQGNTQLRANHPTFGPDGWIYVANGLRGGNVIAVKKDWPLVVDASRVQVKDEGKGTRTRDASTTEPQPVSLTGRDFKFDPLTGRYEAISGNGQFGMTFDAWGNRFVCDNRHPCRHVIFEEDFIKRCPHVAFPAVVHDVIPADDKNQVFPLTSAWTTSNLHAGTFTAACGVCVYTGDWLPEEFRGNVFVCEPTGNLVQRAILEPDGVTFKSRNPYAPNDANRRAGGVSPPVDPKSGDIPRSGGLTPPARQEIAGEFLASRDDWFRPVDLQNGPDGALYVVDMYRAVIEHPEWVPDELKKRPDTWLGNDMGRIYRIRPVATGGSPIAETKGKQPKRDAANLRDRPETQLDSPNGWTRTTARRMLTNPSTSKDSKLNERLLTSAIGSKPIASMRLSLPFSRTEPRYEIPYGWFGVPESVKSEEARVRFEAVQRLSCLDRTESIIAGHILPDVAISDCADPWMRQALVAVTGIRHVTLLAEVIRVANDRQLLEKPGLTDLMSALAEQVGAHARDEELSWCVARLCEVARSQSSETRDAGVRVLVSLAQGLARRGQSLNSKRQTLSFVAIEGFDLVSRDCRMRLMKPSPQDSDEAKYLAARWLRFHELGLQSEVLTKVVEESTDQKLRLIALESIVSAPQPELDGWLLTRYRSETPAIRRAILAALFASKERQLRLLEAIEQGQIAATELDPLRVNQLTQAKDETLRERAKTVLAAAAPASRHEVLDAYRPALALTADPKRGREVFVKNCSTCHRVDNVGVNVAPDISDTRTKKPEQLLLDILDPNKAIDANYFAYAVVTKEGKTESGVISAETATSITLKQPEGKVLTLLRTDIDELRNTGLSLMPVGVEKNVDQQAMADLIFWLKNWRYLDGKVPATSLK